MVDEQRPAEAAAEKRSEPADGKEADAARATETEAIGEREPVTDERDDSAADDAERPAVEGPDTESSANGGFDRDDPRFYLNRELSELEFQKRVLAEATDERNPLLERVKFLAIFTTNVDEFFRKRVGGLKQQIAADVDERTPDGRTPREQWTEVLETARPMFERQTAFYRETLRPALADAGVHVLDYDDLTDGERRDLREYFESSVLPTLTPLTFDPAHPFPHISNLSLSLAVLTRADPDDDLTFSRVKVPRNQPRLVRVGRDGGGPGSASVDGDGVPGSDGAADADAGSAVDGAGGDDRFVLLEDVIADNLDLLFPNVEVVDYSTFRVTRNAEVGRDEEVAEDLIEMIEEVLEERRFATVVRLEIEAGAHPRVREILTDQLGVDDREVFERRGPLALRDFDSLLELDRPELKLDSWSPKPHPRFADASAEDADVFAEIREDDVLVHHPYHSFTGTVQRFLEAAARDPDVLAIKAAIYRTASDSKVVETLIEAARNGKQVAVMVELKARFDEENNLEWAKRLEAEGIHVAYGTIGYKTHTKTSLVVRDEADGVELYSHVGTGNYHSGTAERYEDLGLFTADRDVGQDLVKLFNYFTGHSLHEQYRELLVAPGNMRERFVDLIRNEAECARRGEDARIVAKMNRLEDPEIVAELYEASMAGVDIDLVIRDICRLRPGLDGVSENVDVYSVVGRFLEHSRIFSFANDDPGYYVGSADWMTRNLDNRVEAVAPIEDPRLRERLDRVLATLLSDNRQRWQMTPDGSYEQIRPDEGEDVRSAQETFMREAAAAIRERTDP